MKYIYQNTAIGLNLIAFLFATTVRSSEPVAGPTTLKSMLDQPSPFTLPVLPYAFDALEPIIDAETMKIHHGKHHQTYVDNLNKAFSNVRLAAPVKLGDLMRSASTQSDAVRNNSGGHFNHSMYWTMLSPVDERHKIPERLKKALEKRFKSLDLFKEAIQAAGLGRFGSGWVWLMRDQKGELQISTTANQDNPLMDVGGVRGVPVFAVDLWEHAYYLKYQNRRIEYLKAFWDRVDWVQIDAYDQEALDLAKSAGK